MEFPMLGAFAVTIAIAVPVLICAFGSRLSR